jgi:hypothetical protein
MERKGKKKKMCAKPRKEKEEKKGEREMKSKNEENKYICLINR